jgi:hypothetical protein
MFDVGRNGPYNMQEGLSTAVFDRLGFRLLDILLDI